MKGRASRRAKGNALVETPFVLFVLLFLLVYPLLDLATVGLRYTFVVLADYEASLAAALSSTFQQSSSASNPAAMTAADDAVTRVLGNCGGVTVNSVTTRITITNLNTGVTTRSAQKLKQPADTSSNLYMLEPEIQAQIQPLIIVPLHGMTVPGLTEPIQVDVCMRKVSENPQGLNQ